jgi:hypothetical protein
MGAVETVTEKKWTGKTYLVDTYRFVCYLRLMVNPPFAGK